MSSPVEFGSSHGDAHIRDLFIIAMCCTLGVKLLIQAAFGLWGGIHYVDIAL